MYFQRFSELLFSFAHAGMVHLIRFNVITKIAWKEDLNSGCKYNSNVFINWWVSLGVFHIELSGGQPQMC